MIARRLGAVLILGALALFATPGPFTEPASALPFIDCTKPPTPEAPGRGVVGFFEETPNPLPTPQDPFAASSTTTIHDQYGFAGLRYSTYDLGCGIDLASSPDAAIGTSMANWILTFPKALVAATGAMLDAAYHPTFLAVFDPVIATVVEGLRVTLFNPGALLALTATGMVIIWRARRSPLAGTAAAVGWSIFVMLIATVIFQWPLAAATVADRTVEATLSAVSSGLSGASTSGTGGSAGQGATGGEATNSLYAALLYPAWVGGEFGQSNTPAAHAHAGTLFDAQALTWQEAEQSAKDPSAAAKILQAKQDRFTQAAAAVKSEDPDAYEYLTGRRSDTRVGYAVLAAVAAVAATPFLVMSALVIIGALIIVRFGVMLFPAFATLALFPSMRHVLITVGNTIASALINAVLFGIAGVVMVTAMGVVLSPGNALAPWLQILLIFLITIVLWYALSPTRRLIAMLTPGHDPLAEAPGGLGKLQRTLGRVTGRVTGSPARTPTFDTPDGAPRAAGTPEVQGPSMGSGTGRMVQTRAEAAALWLPDDAESDDSSPAWAPLRVPGSRRGRTGAGSLTGHSRNSGARVPRPGQRPGETGSSPSDLDQRIESTPTATPERPGSSAAGARGPGSARSGHATLLPVAPVAVDGADGEPVYVIYRPEAHLRG